MSYCPHCGSLIEEHSNFCGSCGKPIGTAVPSVPNPAAPVPPPVTPIPANTVSDNDNDEPDGGNDIRKILKMAIVALLVGIVVLVLVLLGRSGNSTKLMNASIADTIPEEKATYVMVNGHEFADLGLPSGLKWATCNVGASTPSEDGSYFAWGETTPMMDKYGSSNYKWRDGVAYEKYCEDGKTTLDAADDAATQNWGGGCRMPTMNEFKELLDNCNCSWATMNGVGGYKFISKTNSEVFVFFPASSGRPIDDDNIGMYGSSGCYWSSSLGSHMSYNDAYLLSFYSSNCGLDTYDRCSGLPVRAVYPSGK